MQPFNVSIDNGVAEMVFNHPPVNAFNSQGWADIASTLQALGEDAQVRAIVIRAEGRGFCAGVDIKELAADGNLIVAVNKGNYDTFKAVHRNKVPVIVAVHGFVLGGGIGICGAADIVVASDCARFGVPEVDRGALGAATHLARLVLPHLMRALYYTASTVDAQTLYHHGSVYRVVPRAELDDAALAVARDIAAKDTRVIRAAKEALNGIDPVDVNKSYRFEQGFTFELNLAGVADELRDEFAGTSKAEGKAT